MDFFRARLLWQETEWVKKYHLVNWQTACMPKDQGGLGVLDLLTMNTSLLGKWLWRLETSDGLWQQILRKKYVKDEPISQIKKKQGDSHFWQGLMEVDQCYQQFCVRKVGDGKGISFWHDRWIGKEPLEIMFSRLFDLVFDKKVSLHKALMKGLDNMKFRRDLRDQNKEDWEHIKSWSGHNARRRQRPDNLDAEC